VSRFDQRQGFLMSAIVHLMIMMALINRAQGGRPKPVVQEDALPVRERIFLPSKEVLRQLAPPPARRATPAPVPTPPPPRAKDRISIGPPSSERAKVLELRREDDLTQAPKGRPDALPSAPPAPAIVAASPAPAPPDRGERAYRPEGADRRPTLAESLRNLEQRLGEAGPRGLEGGTGRQMGPLFFDPEGADFTFWINHFKNEVYRNWIVPQAALLGFRGHVDLEFTVERDGSLTNLRMLKSSGTPALDRAAANSLLGSRLLPLPRDFGPPRVTMQVTFFYNQGPQG
jgi:periplasmic protein TonB